MSGRFPLSADISARTVFLDDSLDEKTSSRRILLRPLSGIPGKGAETARREPGGLPTAGRGLPEHQVVHADAAGSDGPHEHVLRPGGPGALRRPPDHGVRLQCALGNEISERCGEDADCGTPAPICCRKPFSTGRRAPTRKLTIPATRSCWWNAFPPSWKIQMLPSPR